MGKITKCTCTTARWLVLGFALLVLGITLALPTKAASQIVQHGIGLQKGCASPKAIGATTECIITASNNDQAGDDIEVQEAFDVVKPSTDAVRVPALVPVTCEAPNCNLPISAVSGNTDCTVGGSLPCLIKAACAACGPGGTPLAVGAVTFSSNAYVILATDPDPLPDQGNIKWRDTCSSGATGCDSETINLAQAPATTVLTCPTCTPANECNTAACNETTNECEQTPKVSTACTDNDGDNCTAAGCENIDGLGQCVQRHTVTTCTPANECNTAACNASHVCVQTPKTSDACTDNDGDNCTAAGCENIDGLGQCVQRHTVTTCTPANECNTAACNASHVCVQTPKDNSTTCTDTDNTACTTAGCDGEGTCDQNHINTCQAICRTPGFWATHARTNPDKPRSQNITQAVIDACDGSLTICGECINTTVPINDAASAVEALCVSPSGEIVLQNARQLTAMALNCCISGFGADCSGDPVLGALFTDCNDACVGDVSTRSNQRCRDEIDCFNNGGQFDPTTGLCQPGGPGNCHEQPLVGLGLNFEPPGPAGSEGDCNDARDKDNHCAVLDLPNCSAKNASGEACCGSDSCEE